MSSDMKELKMNLKKNPSPLGWINQSSKVRIKELVDYTQLFDYQIGDEMLYGLIPLADAGLDARIHGKKALCGNFLDIIDFEVSRIRGVIKSS